MHRFTTDAGVQFIKYFEGFSANLYKCSGGFETIGYGHKLTPDEDYDVICYEKAEELLRNDLIVAERAVLRNIDMHLSNTQFDALVSFTFNLGAASLQRSSLRQKINSDLSFYDPDDIYAEFSRWVYASGHKMLGLLRRREAEARLYLNGIYSNLG